MRLMKAYGLSASAISLGSLGCTPFSMMCKAAFDLQRRVRDRRSVTARGFLPMNGLFLLATPVLGCRKQIVSMPIHPQLCSEIQGMLVGSQQF